MIQPMRTLASALLIVLVLWSVSSGASADPDVEAAQKALASLGHDPGPVDGLMGQATRTALAAYQEANGLDVTAKVDASTMSSLGVTPAFVIQLDVSGTGISTGTVAEVKYVADKPELVLFSFDCPACSIRPQLNTNTGVNFEEALWEHGAEHIYRGEFVSGDHTAKVESNKMGFGPGGVLMPIIEQGEVFSPNPLQGWIIKSDGTEPLVFRVVQGKGYTHVRGHGIIRSPSGNLTQL